MHPFMRRSSLALRMLLLTLAAETCSPAVEPDSPLFDRPNFTHVCCSAFVGIPLGTGSQWTAVSVTSSVRASDLTPQVALSHPI
ncbi:MAG: hypothetical protein A3K13_11510 [Gemmatimonadetes bacterium RIFCSPLOWO2_12_FULL_68_9]|nr:MAG: hypothetical protein A3K13_11510 [Gemmatimonadetes bacterium RIFCSPLOWO2_12_FULL_68_9]